MLTRLNERLDGRLVVCAGQPPGTSSLASLTTSEAYAFRYVPLRNYWLRGEAVHVQPFRPVFRSLGDPAVVLAEEAPRSVSLPPLLIYARRRGAGRVLWGHFSSNNRPFSPETHLLDRFRLELARRVEACVAYTDPIADLLRPYLPDEKIFVARNTLDMDRLFRLHDALAAEGKAAVRRRLHLPTDQPILAFLGRLIPSKGTTLLLDTFARLRAERPASLVVIGDGPDRAAMETRVAREGMADVHFLGALVDEAASAPFLFASDMLLIPGYLGLAVNHAFAFGLPVVSRRAPNGIRFHSPEIAYVEHGRTGMLCAWDDPDDLLNGVQRVLADQPSFSARSLAYARTHLTLDRMVDGLVAAIHYAERVGGSGGSRFGRITFWADHVLGGSRSAPTGYRR